MKSVKEFFGSEFAMSALSIIAALIIINLVIPRFIEDFHFTTSLISLMMFLAMIAWVKKMKQDFGISDDKLKEKHLK